MFPDYEKLFMQHVRQEFVDRCAEGMPKIGLEEYRAMRMNSYEQKYITKHLDDDAFLWLLEVCRRNVQTDHVGSWGIPSTYNVFIMTDGMSELLRRFNATRLDANRWRALDKDHVPSDTLLLLIDKDGEVRLGRWVGYWAMEPGGPFEPVGWAFLPMWGEREIRKPSEEEPQLRYCTLRDDFDGIGPDPSGWSLECRFSDGQKYGAVTVDRPFEKLAVRVMNFLNEDA